MPADPLTALVAVVALITALTGVGMYAVDRAEVRRGLRALFALATSPEGALTPALMEKLAPMFTAAAVNTVLVLSRDEELMKRVRQAAPQLVQHAAMGYAVGSRTEVQERMTNSYGGGALPMRGGKKLVQAVTKGDDPLSGIVQQYAPMFIEKMMRGGMGGGSGGPTPGGGGGTITQSSRGGIL